MADEAVTTGVSVLCANTDLLGTNRLGLLTNFTGVMPGFERNVDALLTAGLNLTALFGPEHGLRGSVQAGQTEYDEVDAATGLPLFDTYMKSGDDLDELVERSGVDTLVFDMQDIGVRYYTYIWSLYDCMLSAARTGKRLVVLDRPNPLGGLVTCGPGLDSNFASFVGRVDVPLRHGLTAGELATLFNERFLPAVVGHSVDLQVVEMENWRRSRPFDEIGLPWVAPSPNMPTLESAFAFCGTGLFEGTNVNEGRGTTKPFEMIGAPYVDGRLIDMLRDLSMPGVAFREVWYVPTFHKYVGETVCGVQLHITDRQEFDPVACGVSMIWAFASLYPDKFNFLAPGERVDTPERGYAIDRLWGSDSLRTTVEDRLDPRTLLTPPTSPSRVYPHGVLLYS